MRHKTQSVKSARNLFADDTNVSTSAESTGELERRLNSDLKNIYQTKTEYMIIESCHNLNIMHLNPEIQIGGLSVKRAKTTKCLAMHGRSLTIN